MTDRFDGWIAGLGTTAGLRAVIGHWRRSPFGSFTDVMVEQPDGHRVLLVPSREVANFVAGIYRFDEVRLTAVDVDVDGVHWVVRAGPLQVVFELGGRPPLGLLLRLVPRRLATAPWWITAVDLVAHRLVPGVRTRGSAGGGRQEYYAALDLRRITSAALAWEGRDQGALAPVAPPVRFGFGSTPQDPSLVRVVTLVRG